MAESLSNEEILAVATRAVGAELGNPDATTPPVSDVPISPDNADTARIDAQNPLASRARGAKKETGRTEAEVQRLIESIPAGASFVLVSPTKKTKTSYFREGDDFYLESERGGSSKSVKTDDIRKQLRTWTLENITSPVSHPVALAVPGAPDPVPPAIPINATELQKGAKRSKFEPKQAQKGRALQNHPLQKGRKADLLSPKSKQERLKDRLKLNVEEASISKEESKQSIEVDLAGVKNFDELFAVLEGHTEVQWERGLTPEQLRNLINHARSWEIGVDNIPMQAGLREIVNRLLQEQQRSHATEGMDAISEVIKNGGKSIVLVSADGKEELVLTRIADKWFDSKGGSVSDDVIKEKLWNNWRILAEEESVKRAFGRTPEIEKLSALDTQIRSLYRINKDQNGKEVESGKLVELRKEYAEAEYRNVGVWQRLREKLGVRKKESDSVPERDAYYQALQQLINLKIERLKNQPELSPEELKEKMVETLQFFGTESKIRLYEAWTQATMKREGVYAKAVGLCEDFGNQYNKLKWWQKVGLGVVALGTSVATGGGAMATGMLVARRAAAGLGSFAMFEGVFEKMSQNRASNIVENKVGEAMIGLEQKENVEARLNHLMETLKSEMSSENLRQELHDRAKGKTIRTLLAAAISFGMMFGIPHIGDRIKDAYFGAGVAGDAADVAKKEAESAAKAAVEHGAPAPGAGTVASEQLKNALESRTDGHTSVGSAYSQSSPGRFDAPSGVATEAVKATVEAPIPADYLIEKGDTTWHILDGYLTDHDAKFAGMTEGQQTHAIDALKDKLRLLSPAQLKEAGFSSRNIDKLRIGDTVHLDKLLGTVDADKAIANAGRMSAEAVKNIEANNTKIAEWAAAHPGVPINEVTIENQILHPHAGVASDVAHGVRGQLSSSGFSVAAVDSSSAANGLTPGVSVESVQSPVSPANAPFDRPSLVEMRRGSDWFMQIFRVDDQVSGKDWVFDKKEILSTKMSDILKVESNGTVSLVENARFNSVQSKNLQEFVSQLPKTFPDGKASLGDFFRARPDISVGEYLARVAKHVPQGTRIGLYTTTN